ncbi:hypothetical protein EDD22DRAFT_851073 [Suillus occidentalis]|nr:hypothetical protein EDD22DRAFT_851073 [Suillus occidentalis]
MFPTFTVPTWIPHPALLLRLAKGIGMIAASKEKAIMGTVEVWKKEGNFELRDCVEEGVELWPAWLKDGSQNNTECTHIQNDAFKACNGLKGSLTLSSLAQTLSIEGGNKLSELLCSLWETASRHVAAQLMLRLLSKVVLGVNRGKVAVDYVRCRKEQDEMSEIGPEEV